MTITILPENNHSHLPAELLAYVLERVEAERAADLGHGLVIHTVCLPEHLPRVPCSIVGPMIGHAPVPESEVYYEARAPREYASRMVRRLGPMTRQVTVIVGPEGDDDTVLYTAFGGPLAPREPGCPDLAKLSGYEQELAARFWSIHALADGRDR
jgi:hypothetical protein